ncbi:glycosyltransferase family 4 protein [Granulicella sp. S190]|uniref:glycosyltransferase family 4 protein n=1 Tax=Granulicella sp. S190 TaxID=1747226 RepID=UPI00131D9BC7|nr:glycosyltransferase family 4 protein [Granulicella sp. S190]
MSMIRALHLAQPSGDGESAALPHILLVLDQFPRTLGGGERIVLRLAALLPRYGYRVSILTFSADPASAGLDSPPCSIYLLPLQRTYDLTAIRAGFELGLFLRRQRVQIVQTFFESSDLWGGFVTKALSDAKLIWSRRDMGILRTGKHHAAYRMMSSVPDKVFAVSELVRQHSIEVDGVEPSRVMTIYNGLDLADWGAISRPAKRSGERLIVTVGNIRRVKGHDVFVRAAALIAKQFPEATFSIAGDVLEPEYFTELQTLVSDLKLSDRFHFAGGVKNLQLYLAEAEIFVLPSRSEGFSNAIVEAMAASLPVIATDVGGNAEAVADGVSGIIVPPGDPEALAFAMMRLLADPGEGKRMGAEGKRFAAEKFTTDAMMRQVTSVYANLLKRG